MKLPDNFDYFGKNRQTLKSVPPQDSLKWAPIMSMPQLNHIVKEEDY